jgi:hypothetical protein
VFLFYYLNLPPSPLPHSTEDGEFELQESDELQVTADDLEEELAEEPQMMQHAEMWDRYLAYVETTQQAWAKPSMDTDEYRKERALIYYNQGVLVPAYLALLTTSISTLPLPDSLSTCRCCYCARSLRAQSRDHGLGSTRLSLHSASADRSLRRPLKA